MEKQLIYFLIAFFPHEFGYSERSYLTYSRSEAYQDEVILGALHCGAGLKSAVIFFFFASRTGYSQQTMAFKAMVTVIKSVWKLGVEKCSGQLC